MQDKVPTTKRRTKTTPSDQLKDEKVEVVVEKSLPIFYGIATTNLTIDTVKVNQGEQVDILEDKGDEWLTDKGIVSKLFLLLKKI
ncbi:hypothetical protein BSK59_16315 [Paenibacillus odorifer]|uniref:hypothetical protein n=1 Tax=Paenibacillus odorifer TaxID=189426 RepID=UPI00096BE57C|nr:hypothetical protein [Paenibacillus odorifer]OME54143.1 hypothetical protein BSK59_16315 [Paenibacillus odorifer]